MLRYFTHLSSATCAIACVLLIALWVRSYWLVDSLSGHTANRLSFQLYSTRGRIVPSKGGPGGTTEYYPWEISLGDEIPETSMSQMLIFPGFDVEREPRATRVGVPQWFLLLLAATFIAITWVRRFSLSALLVVTTLVAMILGITAFLS